MYDLAKRTITYLNRTSTNENVGPTTYVICSGYSTKKNRVPFLSSTPQEPSFFEKQATDAIYDTRENIDQKIKGGSCLRNKAPRFICKLDDDRSDPTAYSAKPIQWIKKKVKLDPTKPKLYACRVPYTGPNSVSIPSVPTKIDENGYEIDDDGNITKIPPDEPEYIELDIKSTFPGPKHCKWSTRTSRRFSQSEDSTGPGPAAYFVKIPKCWRSEKDEEFREMARRLCFIPRFAEAQEMKSLKDGLPGPGHYDLPPVRRSTSERAQSINPRPFINQSPRFKKGTKSEAPSPNSYKICDCYRVQKQFSMKCAPFGCMAARFQKKKIERRPGPGDYEIKSTLVEKLEGKMNPYAIFQPPFNNTAPRNVGFMAKEAEFTPGPAEYPAETDEDDEEDENERETNKTSSSVFKSVVERFPPAAGKDAVSPAKYNVTWSYEKSRAQKTFRVSTLPFHSSGPRSLTPVVKIGVPCPTTYINERGLDGSGHRFNLSPRFKEDEKGNPGPGYYDIHPGYQVATYRAWDTHNLRLKENVLRKKLRQAPKETRKRWTRELKKKKLLTWFNVGLDDQERMLQLVHKLFDQPV